MFKRAEDVNYKAQEEFQQTKLFRAVKRQILRQFKVLQCLLCLSSCIPRLPAHSPAFTESPLCDPHWALGFYIHCKSLWPRNHLRLPRLPHQMRIHNFLQTVPFYQIVFVSSFPGKLEMSRVYVCVPTCMQPAGCLNSLGLGIKRSVASMLNTPLSLCCQAKKKA